MATTLNTLYPPQVETFMPPFHYNDSAKVWFNISSYDEDMIDSIKFIHISMVDQRNNTNVFAGLNSGNTVYPQYYPLVFNGNKNNNNNANNKMGYDPDKKMYWAVIPPQVLKTRPYYNAGQYYKIQLRFDLTVDSSDDTHKGPTKYFYRDGSSSNATANALQLAAYTNENEDNFSEWSVGTLIRPILIPSLQIRGLNLNEITNVAPSTDFPVVGNINFNKAVNDNTQRENSEFLSWYQVQVLDNSKTNVSYNSGKISAGNTKQINTTADLSTALTSSYISITYETNNGYTATVDYPVSISTSQYDGETEIEYNETIDEENGQIIFNISELDALTGYLVVRRTSHYSNFTHWDLIAAKDISEVSDWTLVDNTIESMTGYRYQIQRIDGDNLYSPVNIDNGDILHCDFYGGLLSDINKTLKISFNFQISTISNAINRTKVDTLGGRYPIFTQNSKLKYHTYSIGGKISSEDDGDLFLSKIDVFGPEYYGQRYPSSAPKPHDAECKQIKSNNDWLYEREYRKAVEDWLNNGKPKLFRSMTEGNIIVILDTVTLTPDVTLGRRLYDFTATMYEIEDGRDWDTITSLGLFNVEDDRKI